MYLSRKVHIPQQQLRRVRLLIATRGYLVYFISLSKKPRQTVPVTQEDFT